MEAAKTRTRRARWNVVIVVIITAFTIVWEHLQTQLRTDRESRTALAFLLLNKMTINVTLSDSALWHCWFDYMKGSMTSAKTKEELSSGTLVAVTWLELCYLSSGCHLRHVHHLMLQQYPGWFKYEAVVYCTLLYRPTLLFQKTGVKMVFCCCCKMPTFWFWEETNLYVHILGYYYTGLISRVCLRS